MITRYCKLSVPQQGDRAAFTRLELLVAIGVAAVVAFVILAGLPQAKRKAQSQQCANILKSVSLAFRMWSTDSSDAYPPKRSVSQGGALEFATNGEIAFVFTVMSNEINTPKILICPTDHRVAATTFNQPLANSNLSYFVGIDAEETEPQTLLLGDRNLTNGPLAANRLLSLPTNSAPWWNNEMHRLRGNVAKADGSVQQFDTPNLRVFVRNQGDSSTNRLAFP